MIHKYLPFCALNAISYLKMKLTNVAKSNGNIFDYWCHSMVEMLKDFDVRNRSQIAAVSNHEDCNACIYFIFYYGNKDWTDPDSLDS